MQALGSPEKQLALLPVFAEWLQLAHGSHLGTTLTAGDFLVHHAIRLSVGFIGVVWPTVTITGTRKTVLGVWHTQDHGKRGELLRRSASPAWLHEDIAIPIAPG